MDKIVILGKIRKLEKYKNFINGKIREIKIYDEKLVRIYDEKLVKFFQLGCSSDEAKKVKIFFNEELKKLLISDEELVKYFSEEIKKIDSKIAELEKKSSINL
jgi:hypothetical protein